LSAKKADVSLLTFNVFSGRDTEFVGERVPHIIKEVVSRSPDLLCLQECTDSFAQATIEAAANSSVKYKVAWHELHPEWKCGSAILIKENKFQVLERELVKDAESPFALYASHVEMPQSYTSQVMRLRMAIDELPGTRFDVYNLHLTGGSYGKPNAVLKQRREMRQGQLAALSKSCSVESSVKESGAAADVVLIAGDFNCCPEERNRGAFPEVEQSPEIVDPSAHWIDVGRDLGPTESSTRNKFRSWMKPDQQREARFDRILAKTSAGGKCGLECTDVELVGTEQVGQVRLEEEAVPLFCSDHFGVFAKFALTMKTT